MLRPCHLLSCGLVLLLAACGRGASTPANAPVASPAQTVSPGGPAVKVETGSTSAPVPAETDRRTIAALMRSAFGARYDAAREAAFADLPEPSDRGAMLRHVVIGEGFVRLGDGQTLLVANANPADAEDEPIVSHASGGRLNLYWLRQEQGGWTLQHKEENILETGSHGGLGQVKSVRFAPAQTALAIESGGTWQGYTAISLLLFHVQANGMRALTEDPIRLHSDNQGACSPEMARCWTADATWEFAAAPAAADPASPAFPDLLLRFAGDASDLISPAASTPADGSQEPPRRVTKIAGEAVYRFKDGAYVLIRGENLVPEV